MRDEQVGAFDERARRGEVDARRPRIAGGGAVRNEPGAVRVRAAQGLAGEDFDDARLGVEDEREQREGVEAVVRGAGPGGLGVEVEAAAARRGDASSAQPVWMRSISSSETSSGSRL